MSGEAADFFMPDATTATRIGKTRIRQTGPSRGVSDRPPANREQERQDHDGRRPEANDQAPGVDQNLQQDATELTSVRRRWSAATVGGSSRRHNARAGRAAFARRGSKPRSRRTNLYPAGPSGGRHVRDGRRNRPQDQGRPHPTITNAEGEGEPRGRPGPAPPVSESGSLSVPCPSAGGWAAMLRAQTPRQDRWQQRLQLARRYRRGHPRDQVNRTSATRAALFRSEGRLARQLEKNQPGSCRTRAAPTGWHRSRHRGPRRSCAL